MRYRMKADEVRESAHVRKGTHISVPNSLQILSK